MARPRSRLRRSSAPVHSRSTSVRPAQSGCAWVCANSPATTRAPSRHSPVCATDAPASRCRKCDLPAPFAPSTASRSPKKISVENGRINPLSSSCSHTIARTPVRPPRSRIATRSSTGASGGGPSAS